MFLMEIHFLILLMSSTNEVIGSPLRENHVLELPNVWFMSRATAGLNTPSI